MMKVLMPITLKSSDQDRCKPHIEKVSGEEHVGLDQKGQDRRQLFSKIYVDNKQI